ncbi:hypothetical protein JHD46_02035 [Sulfurimonas sp. SAG-AH-194-C20]|nr:hypothetical protein [Sulfurimonas sp. SAG-AH-194-C20]MDF1878415.1 hypothetical protein [Sulfurimonas sp. SAG-AH-194-C20]
MAKPLNFRIKDQVFDLVPLKLERKKLYGWNEKVILDSNGEVCNTLSLYPELAMLIPKGGIGLGSMDSDGKWIDKADMIYIDEDGSVAELVPSSYEGEIKLYNSATLEYFLEHNITSVYSLQGEENHPDFVKAIQENSELFTFVFNYRADYEGDPAFVIENDGEVFVLVGKKIEFEYIGLDESGMLDEAGVEEDEEDEFDFAMM